MEWVIAALAVGCVFFIVQVVVDHYKYRSVIGPRMDELEAAQARLEQRLEQATAELEQQRSRMDPLRGEVDELEQQRVELERQLAEERARGPVDLPVRRRHEGEK